MSMRSHDQADADKPEQIHTAGALTRRAFLHTAGGAAAGGLAVAAGAGLIAERAARAADGQEPARAPSLPWKYAKLDALEAGRRGYVNYLEKGG